MTNLKTVEELRQQILKEMNTRRIDGKTYIDSEWLLSEYEKILHTNLVAAVEGIKQKPRGVWESAEVSGYNQALDDMEDIIKQLLESKN